MDQYSDQWDHCCWVKSQAISIISNLSIQSWRTMWKGEKILNWPFEGIVQLGFRYEAGIFVSSTVQHTRNSSGSRQIILSLLYRALQSWISSQLSQEFPYLYQLSLEKHYIYQTAISWIVQIVYKWPVWNLEAFFSFSLITIDCS